MWRPRCWTPLRCGTTTGEEAEGGDKQIRPLTEPLVKELEQHGGQHGGRNEKRGARGP